MWPPVRHEHQLKERMTEFVEKATTLHPHLATQRRLGAWPSATELATRAGTLDAAGDP